MCTLPIIGFWMVIVCVPYCTVVPSFAVIMVFLFITELLMVQTVSAGSLLQPVIVPRHRVTE